MGEIPDLSLWTQAGIMIVFIIALGSTCMLSNRKETKRAKIIILIISIVSWGAIGYIFSTLHTYFQ